MPSTKTCILVLFSAMMCLYGFSQEENTSFTCADGIDNDGDGLVDCDDPQCFELTVDNCPQPTNCYDEFPCELCEGSFSYADSVVSFLPQCATHPDIMTDVDDPSVILGYPDYTNALSLGSGGIVILGFTNNFLSNSGDGDIDLFVFEGGGAAEGCAVYALPSDADTDALCQAASMTMDADGFYLIGDIGGSVSGVDLDALVSLPAYSIFFSQVKLIDDADDDCGTFYPPGADIDAICATSSVELGCIDEEACNYSETATVDDESCTYVVGDCDICEDGEVIINDTDGDGICDPDEIPGCQDPEACNFNPLSTDDEICIYALEQCEVCQDGDVVLLDEDGDGICDEEEIPGCEDPVACNYEPTATEPADCIYATEDCSVCENGEAVILDADGDGICDGEEIAGCPDPLACNYVPQSTDPIECIYADGPCDICQDGAVLDLDADDDGICNYDEIPGCLDSLACNYEPLATDLVFCDYLTCLDCAGVLYGRAFIDFCGECVHPDDASADAYSSLFIPTAFTPDGDGGNDLFRPVFRCPPIEYEVEIYDRTGIVVFRSEDWREPWSGNVGGGEYYAENGIYTYVVTFSFPGRVADKERVRGTVLLLR